MDTLILLEDDKEHTRIVKEPEITNPDGITSVDEITSNLQFFDNAALKALGDPTAAFGIAYFRFIVRNIINFGAEVLKREAARPQHRDAVPVQIVAEFHQTNMRLAREITKAFKTLPTDATWLNLPKKYDIELAVHRVWLFSCESGGDQAANAKLSRKYRQQATDMREAAMLGFIRPLVAPPSNPPECWYPYVYTFSTGDIVKGSLTLHPNHVAFKLTPDWQVDANGDIKPLPPPANPSKTEPSGGTVYRYDLTGGRGNSTPQPCGLKNAVITPAPVGANGDIDILKNPFRD